MSITDAEIAEWRALQGEGMTSAVGEYTPEEFWRLLDAFEAQRNESAARDVLLAEARMVFEFVLHEVESLPSELEWMVERAAKGRRIYVDGRALANQPATPNVQGMVEALTEIVRRYPDPNISHVDFRVHACRHAESALSVRSEVSND